jgi:uncharacterized SAM-binding protein YcdF (DUF218 family)
LNWLATKILSAFLLPPLSFLLIGLAGLAILKIYPRLARAALGCSLALLWIFSMPVVGSLLVGQLETGQVLPLNAKPNAQAIVVLGGGVCYDAPELGESTACEATLQRLKYAAWLYRRTQLPILVTGGDPEKVGVTESSVMARVLEHEFNVPVRWQESGSDNTLQNAVYSRRMLSGSGVNTILLVSQGWHLPRAARLFRQAGFNVIPAGTGFHVIEHLSVLDFLPSEKGLVASHIYFHETIGDLWARLHPQ